MSKQSKDMRTRASRELRESRHEVRPRARPIISNGPLHTKRWPRMRCGWPARSPAALLQTRSRPAPSRMAIPGAASAARAECKRFHSLPRSSGGFFTAIYAGSACLRFSPHCDQQRSLSAIQSRCQRRYADDFIALRAGIPAVYDGFHCPFCPTRHERGSPDSDARHAM